MIRIANAASQVTISGLKNLPVQFRGSHASMLIPDVAEVAI